MSEFIPVFYPQAAIKLWVRWEDFGDTGNPILKEIYNLPILARRVSVSINDYTQADTFDCEIDYKEFPFDPRCIRSCGVSVFMQDQGSIFKSSDNGLDRIEPRNENAVFLGFADEESISFDDTKRTVKLEGRDQTSILIDRKYLAGTLDLSRTIDVVLQGILDELPENKAASDLGKLKLENRVDGELPVLSSFWGDKEDLGGHKNVKRDETYWEVIQDLVGRAGLIAYIELDKLILSKPRVLYNKSKPIQFIYGKNLSNLEFKRKIGRRKNFNIIVRSLNIETKEVLNAKIPAEASEEWSKATGISNTEVKIAAVDAKGVQVPESDSKPAPYISFRLPNIHSKEQLISIGQEIYEEIGRQQIEGSFETNDMLAFDSTGVVFDLLKLRNGSPVAIKVEQGDLKGISNKSSKSAREKFLISRGYDSKIAGVFAETLGKIATPFYTKSVTYTMDGTAGFKCKVDFINFIEITNKAFGGG